MRIRIRLMCVLVMMVIFSSCQKEIIYSNANDMNFANLVENLQETIEGIAEISMYTVGPNTRFNVEFMSNEPDETVNLAFYEIRKYLVDSRDEIDQYLILNNSGLERIDVGFYGLLRGEYNVSIIYHLFEADDNNILMNDWQRSVRIDGTSDIIGEITNISIDE